MKRALKALCLIPLAAVLALAGCDTSPRRVFKRATGVELPQFVQTTTIDTRGGFHGDGELIYTFYIAEEDERAVKYEVQTAEHWSPLPMSATLNRVVYEHFGGKIPRVADGYYFFYDEQHGTYSDDKIENAYSYDFVIGMYDSRSRIAYYYEQHT